MILTLLKNDEAAIMSSPADFREADRRARPVHSRHRMSQVRYVADNPRTLEGNVVQAGEGRCFWYKSFVCILERKKREVFQLFFCRSLVDC